MATRKIRDNTDGTIYKIVPFYEELENKHFPSFDEINEDWLGSREQIYKEIEGLSRISQSAVIQQYNEYVIWYNCEKENSILAPVIGFFLDKNNLPVLKFPKFCPIVENDIFYKYKDEENYIQLGMFAQKVGIDFDFIKHFLSQVEEIEDEFNLNIEDIIYNLSNIGYNFKYGLRVIDYGLIKSNNNNFELVI